MAANGPILVAQPEEGGDIVYSIAVLTDELRNEDIQVRLNAVRNLPTIALALGPEVTREQLMEFLAGMSDEGQVMFELAKQLGHFVPCLGGPEYAHRLLPSLENLASFEESVVREKAVESLRNVAGSLPVQRLESDFVAMIVRMANCGWFTSRSSVCALFSAAYRRVDVERKRQLRIMFHAMCEDDIPGVRISAASKFGEFAEVVEAEHAKEELFPIFEELAKDDQDSARISSAGAAVVLIPFLRDDLDKLNRLNSIIKELAVDQNWRAHLVIASQIVEMQKAFEDKIALEEIVQLYISLLKDDAPDVRASAASNLQGFCAALPEARRQEIVVNDILPVVCPIVSDANQHVKIALASVVMGLAQILDHENTITQLFPIFVSMLRDEIPEVRLNIISSLDKIIGVIDNNELQQHVLPAVIDLAGDEKWRVRLAVVERMPKLAQQLGQQFFEDQLLTLCIASLTDHVFAIREAAVDVVRQLCEQFGPEWILNMIFPKIIELADHGAYLCRMVCLLCFNALAPSVGKDKIIEHMIPVLKKLAGDKVANVRFNVAKSLELIATYVDRATIDADIEPTLQRLVEDDECDVTYFSRRALAMLNLGGN